MPMNPRLLRPRAAASTAFDPRQIASLGLWLDASVDSSITFNGNTVSEWRDLSGNGRHFAQATAASQPNGVDRTQNGKRVLDFDGNRVLAGNSASLNFARAVGGVSIFFAGKWDTLEGQATGVFISRGDSASSGRCNIDYASSVSGFRMIGRRLDTDSAAVLTTAGNTNAGIFAGIFDYANSDGFFRINGSTVASSTSFQANGVTQDNDSVGISIGGIPSLASGLDGFIGEVVIYRRALTVTEQQTLERYLGAKWNITVA